MEAMQVAATPRSHRAWRAVGRICGEWRQDLHVFDNPFAVRDVRSRMRGARFAVLLLAYHAAILLLGLIAVAIYAGMARRGTALAAGSFVFPFLAYTQMALAPMVAGSLTAAVLTVERERQTQDLLTVSTLRGVQVALGKVVIPWALTLLVGFTAAPYLFLCVASGGVSLADIVQFYIGFAVYTALLATLGLVISSMARSSASAVVQTVLIYGLSLAGSAALLGLALSFTYMGTGRTGTLATWLPTSLGMTPITWVLALTTPQVFSSGSTPSHIPFWLPGICVWGTLIAYMILVAGCRAGYSPRRHLVARRVLGLASWAAVAAGIASGLTAWMGSARGFGSGASQGLFSLWRKSSPEIDALIIGSSLFTILCAGAALSASVGDSDRFLSDPIRRAFRGAVAPPRPLAPEPEHGLSMAVLAWCLGVGLLLIAVRVAKFSLVPMGWGLALAVLLPQLTVLVFAAMCGLRATVRLPYKPKERRMYAWIWLVALLLWPAVISFTATMVGGLVKSGRYMDEAMVWGTWLSSLSPLFYASTAGMTSMTDPTAQKMWLDLGGISLHPSHLAALMGVLLAALSVYYFVREARRWRKHCEEWWNQAREASVS